MLSKVFNAKVLLVIFHILVVGFVKPFFYVILCYLSIFCLFFVFFPRALICFVSLDIIWLFSYVIMKISVYLYLYTDKLYLRIWIYIHRICALEVNKLLLLLSWMLPAYGVMICHFLEGGHKQHQNAIHSFIF